MILKNATINFLGDSITEGAGASCVENRFTDVMAREYGVRANNYGIGGSRIARQVVMTQERCDRDYCMRMAEMDETADAVVVFGGTNDFGHGEAPVGTPEDRDPSTFYGACHTLMKGLLERYCGKPVVIVTPLHRLEEDCPQGDGSGRRRNTALLKEYRAILMEVAEFYALPVLDLWSVSGMQPRVDVCRERLMPDGLHPNDAGHAILAHRIAHFLESL